MNPILKNILDAAKQILPAIVPGADLSIKLGKAVLDALDAAAVLAQPGDQADYGETRDALRAKVLPHFDDTISGLRGG